MAKQLISRIQLRRDTAANWKTNNTTLSKGEIALSYDVDENGVALPSSYRVKIGDGTTKWNSLDYFAQGVLVGSGAPAASLGENGQFYVDTTNKYLYFKNNGAWITIGGDISGELDKKLDKNKTASYSVYGVAGAGDQVMFSITGGHNQIVGVGGDGKIPVGLLPDVVLGNVLYGGNLTNAPTSNDVWAATPSASLKTRLGLASTVTSITIKNQEGGTSTTGYGWKALEGVYFIANAKGTFAGIDFEVGDWLISNGDSWQKVDNTDTIKTVGGVSPVDGNIVVSGENGVYVSGANSKLGIGLKLVDETQLTGGATAIAETDAQVSALRLDKDGKLGVVIPKGVEYTGTENQIQITNGKIGLTSTAKTDIFRTNNLEVTDKGSQYSQLAQNGIGQFNLTGGVTEYSLLNYQALMHGKTSESTTTGGFSAIILPPIPASGSNQFAMPEIENTTGERIVVDLVGAQTNNKFTGKNAFTQPIVFGPNADATSASEGAAALKFVRDASGNPNDGKVYLSKGMLSGGEASTGANIYTFSKSDGKTHEVATMDDIPTTPDIEGENGIIASYSKAANTYNVKIDPEGNFVTNKINLRDSLVFDSATSNESVTIKKTSGTSGAINLTLPTSDGQLATRGDILTAISGKQDKLTPGRNIEITGTTIQTTKELDASKISNSSGGLIVGSGSSTVQIQASGVSLTAISSVNISANTATIDANGGVSINGDVAMADNLTVSGTIKTLPNNPAEQTLHEVVVDMDYVIIDGGTSTTTW